MKWKSSRVIGFNKEAEVGAAKEEKIKADKAPTSKGIYAWLQKHPLINLNGLCTEAGYDRANFSKAKKKGWELPTEVLEKMVKVLKTYGYAE